MSTSHEDVRSLMMIHCWIPVRLGNVSDRIFVDKLTDILYFYSTGYRANFRFKNAGNAVLQLVSRLRLSAAVTLMPPIHSCCSLLQVYHTSCIYPPLVMYGIILLYFYVPCVVLTQCGELFLAP